MRTLQVSELHAELKAQAVPREHLAFICPVCGTVQSAADLIKAGAGKDFDAVEKYLGFSCVGRWAGPFHEKSVPGQGCDWTLGGLFRIHRLEVINDYGKPCPMFEIASPEQAKNHMEAFGQSNEVAR